MQVMNYYITKNINYHVLTNTENHFFFYFFVFSLEESLGSCVMVRDINPVFEYNCSSRDNSSKYSLMDYYNDSGERYNFSTTSLQYHSSTDNLLPKNKSYTAIVKNENVSEKVRRWLHWYYQYFYITLLL